MQKRLYALARIWLLMSLLISLSCNLEWGGDDTVSSNIDTCQTVDVELVSVSSGGSQANGNSENPSISSDGQFIAFISEATNLVLNDSNGVKDVFVHDRDTGDTERVSLSSSGTETDDESFADCTRNASSD